jgi:hypothetical protein
VTRVVALRGQEREILSQKPEGAPWVRPGEIPFCGRFSLETGIYVRVNVILSVRRVS